MKKYIYTILFFLIICTLYASSFNYSHIPIQEEGRIKPLDSFARNQLLKFNGKTSLTIYICWDDQVVSDISQCSEPVFSSDLESIQKNKKLKINAIDWLMPILIQDIKTLDIPIFKIENPDVVNVIKLEWRPKSTYSYNEINNGLNYIDNNINNPQLIENLKIRNSNQKNSLDLIDKQLLDLSQKRDLFNQLYHSASFLLPNIKIENSNISRLLQIEDNQLISYASLIISINNLNQKIEQRSKQDREKLLNQFGQKFIDDPNLLSDFILQLLIQEINFDNVLYQTDILKIFPTNKIDNTWMSPNDIIEKNIISEYVLEIMILQNLFKSYINNTLFDSNQLLSYKNNISSQYDINTNLLIRESNYNKAQLFYWSLIFYILSFISATILVMSKFFNSKFRIVPFLLLIIGFLYNTSGLIIRMSILNRPPVSTLYESIIFVAFIAVLLAIILEIIRRDNLSLLIGSLSGIILHYLSFGYAADGDTFGVLVAVLNSNFWLATHVTTITTGYGTTIIASLVGHLYLLKYAWNPNNKKELQSIFNIMLATTFIALFFTMFGTILGGIWGDQSWGRFWGWDPKENGALLIVMWLLMMLHLKISGWVKGPGYALGLVLANITVALAWFGVNLLSVGLHNYGFTEGAALNLLLFTIFELLFGSLLYIKIRISNYQD